MTVSCFAGSCRVANLIVFNCKGDIIYAVWNAPGAQHDSTLARGLYDLLSYCCPPGFFIVADTAFGHPRILKPLKSDEIRGMRNAGMSVDAMTRKIKRHSLAVSVRQAAEWGMHGIQGTWRRLRLPLPADTLFRRNLLEIVGYLHNYRTRTVGISQIATVYSGMVPPPVDMEDPQASYFDRVWNDECE